MILGAKDLPEIAQIIVQTIRPIRWPLLTTLAP